MPTIFHDGETKLPDLFRIGVKPLDIADWIDVDSALPAYLDEKEMLGAARWGEIFAAEMETGAAQSEVLELIALHLVTRFPEIYRRAGSDIEILPAGRKVALDAPDRPPLWTAAQLVQDDLVLMRKGAAGWHLVAGALCFPSSWRLADKIGRPMDQVHSPVPGFGIGTRNAILIARMFDTLRPGLPVVRWNWSLYGDSQLFHPESCDPNARRFGAGAGAENVFLRSERQTLRRLPESGDILFMIRIYIDPLAVLEKQPEAGRIAAELIAQVDQLDAAQLAYKGLTLERDRLLVRLGELVT